MAKLDYFVDPKNQLVNIGWDLWNALGKYI